MINEGKKIKTVTAGTGTGNAYSYFFDSRDIKFFGSNLSATDKKQLYRRVENLVGDCGVCPCCGYKLGRGME